MQNNPGSSNSSVAKPAAKQFTPESVLKKRKANEKNAAERATKDIERKKVCLYIMEYARLGLVFSNI